MKTKRLTYTLLLLCCIAALAGCTRNNGGEADFYGQWHLMSMEREGKDVAGYDGNVYWSFQSSTIDMKEVLPHNAPRSNYGNYRVIDETLYIDFSCPDFMPPAILGLPRQAELQIIELSGGRMTLAYGSPATVYRFKRW